MHSEPVNFLPFQRQEKLRREYRIRRVVAGLMAAFVIVLLASAFLIPTNIVLSREAQEKQHLLTLLETELASDTRSALSLRLRAVADDEETLLQLRDSQGFVSIMESVAAIPNAGITLTEFSFHSSGTLILRGVASTRETLRAYQTALQSIPKVARAELPVSTYVKDLNLPFSITLTLSP